MKAQYLPHYPDDPVVLHREDMINARKSFKVLREQAVRERFDNELLRVIEDANFRIVAVVVDKHSLRANYGEAAAHPYHLGLGFLLQRFTGYLNHVNRVGDVLAESRGGVEDRLLKDSYSRVYDRGVWMTSKESFQSALTSTELILKPKSANVSGLQLADLLGHPIKRWVLRQQGIEAGNPAPFAERLVQVVQGKFNRHLYDGRIPGYGYVLYPRR